MTNIIPAIDVIDGKCVRLTKGDYATKKVYDYSPLDMVLQYADLGVNRIHMVDLDGAKVSSPKNLKTLETVAARTSLEIEWGGGISGPDALQSVFNAGATQAIVGSIAALEPEKFSNWLLQFGGSRMLLGSDVKNGAVAVKGWQKQTELLISDQIGWFVEDGLKYVICTEISRDGMLQGPAFDLYESLQKEFPTVAFTASGGVSSMADIEKLAAIGVPGAIVGKAIYEHKISLEDIKRWQLQNA